MRPGWTAPRSLKESKILTNIEKAFVTLSKFSSFLNNGHNALLTTKIES